MAKLSLKKKLLDSSHSGMKSLAEKISAPERLDIEKEENEKTGEWTARQLPDFRDLSEPDRTLKRLHYILTAPELPLNMVQRAVAAVIIDAMKDGGELLKMKELFPESMISPGSRQNAVNALATLGLFQKKIINKKGTEIRLMF